MEICVTNRFLCSVCGRESQEHARWFLVVEDRWLDRVKILSWHPALAEQAQMHSVCGKRHLQSLITHWLTYANLEFVAARSPEFALTGNEDATATEPELTSAGRLVGELTVLRESVSQLWIGSPEAQASIFEALVGGLEVETPLNEAPSQPAEPVQVNSAAVPAQAGPYFGQFALQ